MECLIKKIHLFYTTPDATTRKQIENDLQLFQKSESCWNSCRIILDGQILSGFSAEVTTYALMFATSSLSKKIIYNLSELPSDQQEKLKTFLLNTLLSYSRVASSQPQILPVIAQLCRCLAQIAVLSEYWTNAVNSIPQSLNGDPFLILKILKEIPAEYETLTSHFPFVVPSTRFKTFRENQLGGKIDSVIQICDSILSQQNSEQIQPTLLKEIFSCFNNWMETDYYFRVQPERLSTMKLIDIILQEYLSQNNHPNETYNAVFNLLKYLGGPHLTKSQPIFLKIVVLFRKINEKVIKILLSLPKIEDENEQTTQKLCFLARRACRSFIELILECQPQALEILQITLSMIQIPCRSASCILLDFIIELLSDMDVVTMSEKNNNQTVTLQNIAVEVVKKVIDRSVFDETVDTEEIYNSQGKFMCYNEDFLEFRENSYDALLLSVQTFKPDDMIQKVIFRDKEFSEKYLTNISSRYFESTLFALSAYTKKQLNDDNLQKVVQLLSQSIDPKSLSIAELLSSADAIIGNISPRLVNSPEIFRKCFDFLIWQADQIPNSGINHKRLSSAVAITIEGMFYTCPSLIGSDFNGVTKLFQKYDLFVNKEDKRHFANGIFQALSLTNDVSFLNQTVMTVVVHCISLIKQSPISESAIITGLEGLSHFVQCVDIKENSFRVNLNETMSKVLKIIWEEFLKDFIQIHHNNEMIMELTISRLCKYYVRNFPLCFMPFVERILNTFEIVIAKNTIPSSFLYLSAIIVEKYNNEDKLTAHILDTFCPFFFLYLSAAKERGVYNNTTYYMIEDLYRLCYKYVNNAPKILYSSRYLENLFVVAVEELEVEDYYPFELMCEFIKRTLITAKKVITYPDEKKNDIRKPVLTVLEKHHEKLLRQILRCVYKQRKEFVYDLCDLLIGLINLDQNTMKKKFSYVLQTELPQIGTTIKQNFFYDFFGSKSLSEKCEVVEAFHRMCQLNYVCK